MIQHVMLHGQFNDLCPKHTILRVLLKYDENAVSIQVQKAIAIIGRKPGYETHFMIRGFAEGPAGYPLRDKDPQFRITIDLGTSQFFLTDKKKGSATQAQGAVAVEDLPGSGIWLTPQWDKVEEPNKLLHASIRPGYGGNVPDTLRLTWHGMRT